MAALAKSTWFTGLKATPVHAPSCWFGKAAKGVPSALTSHTYTEPSPMAVPSSDLRSREYSRWFAGPAAPGGGSVAASRCVTSPWMSTSPPTLPLAMCASLGLNETELTLCPPWSSKRCSTRRCFVSHTRMMPSSEPELR